MQRTILTVLLCALVPLCALAADDEKAIADFYSKKTVTIAVGSSAGGNYDLYARLVARHIGAHIPGKPLVVVQNLPGAGSRRLANVLSNVGPHDGTMIGLPNQGIAMDQALGAEGVQYDARKFRWIGSPIEDVNVLWAWHTNPVKTVEDAKQREFVAGATGPGSPTTFYPRIMNTVLGTKFKIVPGYPGSNELDLAIEKAKSAAVSSAGRRSRSPAISWRPARPTCCCSSACARRRTCPMCVCCRTSPATIRTGRFSSFWGWSERWDGRFSCRPAHRRSVPRSCARRSSPP